GLRPHIRLLRGSRSSMATTALLPVSGGVMCPPAGQDLLLSRTVIGRREVALRGPLRLRLASACLVGPVAGSGASGACPAKPRTRGSAIHERYLLLGEMSDWTLRPKHHVTDL